MLQNDLASVSDTLLSRMTAEGYSQQMLEKNRWILGLCKNRHLRAHCTVKQSHPAGVREPLCRMAQPVANYAARSTDFPIE